MEASVIAEAEFIQIGLIVATASMIGAKKECFEVANGNVNPFEICSVTIDVRLRE